MLSTNYRLRLEAICKDIASGTEVSMSDMIWATKLAKANTSARGMLSSARRMATDPDGSCLKYLDIGNPNTNKKGFNGEMISQIGLRMINQMIGGNEIDCLEYYMDDCNTLDFCINYDILYNEIRSSISE